MVIVVVVVVVVVVVFVVGVAADAAADATSPRRCYVIVSGHKPMLSLQDYIDLVIDIIVVVVVVVVVVGFSKSDRLRGWSAGSTIWE